MLSTTVNANSVNNLWITQLLNAAQVIQVAAVAAALTVNLLWYSAAVLLLMVPGAGIEPARSLKREILSLLCLPISPSGLLLRC